MIEYEEDDERSTSEPTAKKVDQTTTTSDSIDLRSYVKSSEQLTYSQPEDLPECTLKRYDVMKVMAICLGNQQNSIYIYFRKYFKYLKITIQLE